MPGASSHMTSPGSDSLTPLATSHVGKSSHLEQNARTGSGSDHDLPSHSLLQRSRASEHSGHSLIQSGLPHLLTHLRRTTRDPTGILRPHRKQVCTFLVVTHLRPCGSSSIVLSHISISLHPSGTSRVTGTSPPRSLRSKTRR